MKFQVPSPQPWISPADQIIFDPQKARTSVLFWKQGYNPVQKEFGARASEQVCFLVPSLSYALVGCPLLPAFRRSDHAVARCTDHIAAP